LFGVNAEYVLEAEIQIAYEVFNCNRIAHKSQIELAIPIPRMKIQFHRIHHVDDAPQARNERK
jgi:hypothetical protein